MHSLRTSFPLLGFGGGRDGRGRLGLRDRRRLEVLPPEQEGGIAQITQILTGHVIVELRPGVGEYQLFGGLKGGPGVVIARVLEVDVLAHDEDVVAGFAGGFARARHSGSWVFRGAGAPALLRVGGEECVLGVLHEVDVAVRVVRGRLCALARGLVGLGVGS